MSDVAISLILVVVAVLVSAGLKLGVERDLIVATARALVQLVGVAAVIDIVFESLGLAGVLLLVMLAAASWTSGRRLRGVPGAYRLAAAAIGAAAGVALLVLFGAGVFPLEPQWLIPIGGMLIGNSMTTTSLAGARMRDEVSDKTTEIEARLALGVHVREALMPYVRRAATAALIPIIDATKNAGLILLPGAFVGMILGGESPADAARVQLVVLYMLLGAVAVAGMASTLLVARAFIGPGERIVVPGPVSKP
jgi:putative ABC transport system permease protein